MCQWFVTEFLDINSEILAQMTGLKVVSSNHVFNHFLTLLQMVGLFVQAQAQTSYFGCFSPIPAPVQLSPSDSSLMSLTCSYGDQLEAHQHMDGKYPSHGEMLCRW